MNPHNGKYIIWVKSKEITPLDWWWPHVAYDSLGDIQGAYKVLLEQCEDSDIVITKRIEKK
jgi:hypothetical protein